MEKLDLVIPSIEHKDEYNEMMLEWEKTKERIFPGSLKRNGNDYSKWLEIIESYKKNETCPTPLVPSDLFFLVNEYNRILGAISIRHYLNGQLLKFGGHIGYGVRPTERGKGYAKIMLKMALNKCRDMDINRVLLVCNKDNIASAKTIMANDGILENELVEDDGNIVQRYWIEV